MKTQILKGIGLSCLFIGGFAFGLFINFSREEIVIREISILAERKKCEEMGGMFGVLAIGVVDSVGNAKNIIKADAIIELSCTSPDKELFKYEIR